MRHVALAGRFAVYGLIFLKELLVANFQVARMVLSPRLRFKSAAISFRSGMKTNAEMVVITNSITLTPGTLVMDANARSGVILVHAMSAESEDQIKSALKSFPEEKALWAFRGGRRD